MGVGGWGWGVGVWAPPPIPQPPTPNPQSPIPMNYEINNVYLYIKLYYNIKKYVFYSRYSFIDILQLGHSFLNSNHFSKHSE